jgi:hypothetical protein
VRDVVSEILYFCDKAYVMMTDLSEVMPLLQKNIDINETVEFSWRQSVNHNSSVGLRL